MSVAKAESGKDYIRTQKTKKLAATDNDGRENSRCCKKIQASDSDADLASCDLIIGRFRNDKKHDHRQKRKK
jgi:3-hydroxyacyl-CoA dehydrogenase/enoyl-CoA hydratase/3-hydroxybutyryl-CoA epimerase